MKREQPLPDSLVIGPQKAGTSWIAEYLEARQDVALPLGVKETFYFDRRFQSKPIEWYAAHFAHRTVKHLIAIEVAPTYFHDAEAPKRVARLLGKPRLVCTLRHPLKRAYSLYLHMLRYGFTRLPLREAVAHHPEILSSSRYAECLQRWLDLFDRDSLLVLEQEELAANPDRFVQSLCAHLNLPHFPIPDALRTPVNEASVPRHFLVAAAGRLAGDALRNYRLYSIVEFAKKLGLKRLFFGNPYHKSPGKSQPKLSADDAVWLSNQLRGEAQALENLLGRSFPGWEPDLSASNRLESVSD